MARAHFVRKARKDNPAVKKGESYYWWEFPYGGKHYSKTSPMRSQLTQSSFLSQLYDIQDDSEFDTDNLEGSRDDLVSQLQSLKDECQDSLDNMPEHLQESSFSGETLRERIDNLESWICDLDGVDCDPDFSDIDEDDSMSEEEKNDAREAKLEEIKDELQNCDQYF